MRDKDIEELLRETWQPKPPSGLKQKALSAAAQPPPHRRSPLRRFALKAAITLTATAIAAGLVFAVISSRIPNPDKTRVSHAPPSGDPQTKSSKSPSLCFGARPLRRSAPGRSAWKQITNPQVEVVAQKAPKHKPGRQIARGPATAAGAQVSYVDAEKFDSTQAEVPSYTTAPPNPEPDGGVMPESRMAYTRPTRTYRLRVTGRTGSGAPILSPDTEDIR